MAMSPVGGPVPVTAPIVRTVSNPVPVQGGGGGDQFTPSQPVDFRPPTRADMLRAAGSQFVQGVGDQFVDVWEAVTNPRETYQALRGLTQRVIDDPRGAARSVVQAGEQLAQDVQSNNVEQNARLAGQNAPIPGLRQAAALGAMVRVTRAARIVGRPLESAVQHQLGRMPHNPDRLRHLDGPQPHAEGSVVPNRTHRPAVHIEADSQAIELSQSQRRVLNDPANRLDNPRAFSSDFNSNGIHVRPADGRSHIRYRFEEGRLSVTSADGASAGQLDAARLRLLSDGQFRQQLGDQIRSGLERMPPRDPNALRQAQDFLQYLDALQPH